MFNDTLDFVEKTPEVLEKRNKEFFDEEEMTVGEMISVVRRKMDDLARRITIVIIEQLDESEDL